VGAELALSLRRKGVILGCLRTECFEGILNLRNSNRKLKKLLSEEIHNLYSSSDIIGVV
jgi:hypothetical protein